MQRNVCWALVFAAIIARGEPVAAFDLLGKWCRDGHGRSLNDCALPDSGTCDDYCRKAMPQVRPPRCGGCCDDYRQANATGRVAMPRRPLRRLLSQTTPLSQLPLPLRLSRLLSIRPTRPALMLPGGRTGPRTRGRLPVQATRSLTVRVLGRAGIGRHEPRPVSLGRPVGPRACA